MEFAPQPSDSGSPLTQFEPLPDVAFSPLLPFVNTRIVRVLGVRLLWEPLVRNSKVVLLAPSVYQIFGSR